MQATQAIIEGNLSAIRLHPDMAFKLALSEGSYVTVQQKNQRVKLLLMFDKRVPMNGAYIPGAMLAASGLSELFGPIEILK